MDFHKIKAMFKKMDTEGRLLEEQYEPDILEELHDQLEKTGSNSLPGAAFSKVWSAESAFSGIVLGDAIESFLRENSTDSLVIQKRSSIEFRYDVKCSSSVLVDGITVYTVRGILIQYFAAYTAFTISSNKNLEALIAEISNYIRTKNKLIGHNYLYSVSNNRGISLVPAKPNNTNFEDIVLDPDKKEIIRDNTIFHLEHMDIHNGVLISGPPGCGKSMICGAILTEANRLGTTSITCSSFPMFSFLEEITTLFLLKVIVVLEDIDSYAESRVHGSNNLLGSLLQYLNGVNGREGKAVYLATTNHMELLDEAIKNRPVRFNVKIDLTYLRDDEIQLLLKKLFNLKVFKNIEQCYGKNFTGSHLEEIYRRALLKTKKTGISMEEAFESSVSEVINTFYTSKRKLGFN